MGSISDFLENELLDHIFNEAYSNPGSVFLSLSTADPLDTGAGLAEPSGGNYARKEITFGAAASRSIAQNALITFPLASGTWGTITHWGLHENAIVGTILGHGALTTAKWVVSGNTPSIADGAVQVDFLSLATKTDGTNNISDYLANGLLDFAFRNQAFAITGKSFMALLRVTGADDLTGITITEPVGNAYARERVFANGATSPTWDASSGGSVLNTHAINMTTPSASWGTITGVAVCSLLATTDSGVLFYDNSPTGDGQVPGAGDTVQFAIGAAKWILK